MVSIAFSGWTKTLGKRESREQGRFRFGPIAKAIAQRIGDANNTKIVFDFFTMPTVTKCFSSSTEIPLSL